MDNDPGRRARILENIVRKSNLEQTVFDNTFSVMSSLKEILHEMSSEFNDELEEKIDERQRIEYRDRGKFEAQIHIAGDVLLFAMHTDMFQFPYQHPIWQNPYVQANKENAFCGVVHIYNFLSDSFKYNRGNDEGYLIGRIFINREKQFFVEGKRQNLPASTFGTGKVDEAALTEIVERAVGYALDFHLLVPPYDEVKSVTLEQFNTKFEGVKIMTGKRLGYSFNTDDV